MRPWILALGLLASLLAMPAASADPIERCTDVTPVLEYDPVACVNAVYDELGVIDTLGNIVLDATCPYQRILYDDVLGGPFEGARCPRLPIEN